MRKMYILIVAVVAVVAVLAAGAFACGGWKAIGTSYEDDYASTAPISEIHITGKTVAVDLDPSSSSAVEIHRTARYLNYFHSRPAPTHRIEGSVLELGGDDSSTFSSIEYVVRAPAGTRITADVGTGSLDLQGAWYVDAKVSTGSIKVVGGTGDVNARTDTGAISIDLAVPANVEAKAGTGAVDVKVPAGAYRVEASSGLGGVNLGLPSDPNATYRLSLRTNLGGVSLATN